MTAIYETGNHKMFTNYAAAKAYADSIGDKYINIRMAYDGDEYSRTAHKDETITDEAYDVAYAIFCPRTSRRMLAFSEAELLALTEGVPAQYNVYTYLRKGDELEEVEED